MVTPGLRGVVLHAEYPKIRARFVYEHLNDEVRELVSVAETEVISDFHADVQVEFRLDVHTTGRILLLRSGGGVQFARWEDPPAFLDRSPVERLVLELVEDGWCGIGELGRRIGSTLNFVPHEQSAAMGAIIEDLVERRLVLVAWRAHRDEHSYGFGTADTPVDVRSPHTWRIPDNGDPAPVISRHR